MTLRLDSIAHSEIGLVRKSNQDSGLVRPDLVCVADGMGGAAAGDLASAVVIRELHNIALEDDDDPSELLKKAMTNANDAISHIIAQNPVFDGMGTTVCGGLLTGDSLTVVHIGDSRGYLLRDGRLTRITHDHSYVQSLIDEGKIEEDEAITHPHRSLLLKVLNGQSYAKPEFFSIPLEPGDRLMFCSDGLCGLVPDSVIAEHIAIDSPDEAMEAMIRDAHNASGSDNITIILSDVRRATTGSPASEIDEHTVINQKRGRHETLKDGAQSPLPISRFATSGVVGAAAIPNVIRHLPRPRRKVTELSQPTEAAVPKTTRTPRTKKKRSPTVLILVITVAVLALAGGVWAVYSYGASQFYVAESEGHIAIYQGFRGTILGIPTGRVYEVSDVELSDLPTVFQSRVTEGIDIDSGGLSQARVTVRQLDAQAQACVATRESRPPWSRPGPDGC